MASKNKITKIRNIHIEEFRGLRDVTINFGERLTIICGKNGTSKSTILGIVAQMFNFENDYTKSPKRALTEFKTLSDGTFSSKFDEHFRLSSVYDRPQSMSVNVHVYDGAEDKELDKLKLRLYLRSSHLKARATVRNNTKTNEASDSRKVTHPVIFLSLKRLTPITDRIKYSEKEINEFMVENKKDFIDLNSSILGRRGANKVTKTIGTIDSMVVSGDNYDHESVSVGEDNLGQILQAIFSFKKLKQEYDDYHGGILLIDEIDAGLFPAAQRRLIERFSSLARDLDLQIIMTSHSPELIETLGELRNKDAEKYKLIYLTDTYGTLQAEENYLWADIKLDLYNQTRKITEEIKKNKTPVFFEDDEAYRLFDAMVTRRDVRSLVRPLKDISLGCTQYVSLIKSKIPCFTNESIIVLDGDANGKGYKNIVLLPTKLAPDQLIFEFLYNLDAGHDFWRNNTHRFTKDVFLERSDLICRQLDIQSEPIDLVSLINKYRKSNKKENDTKLRELFKKLLTDPVLKELIEKGGVRFNPYRLWSDSNTMLVDAFNSDFINALRFIVKGQLQVELEEVKSVIKK